MPVKTPMKTLTGQALTGSAPTLATDGIDANDCKGVACVISAESTRTITGGSMLGYAYMPVAVDKMGNVTTWRWFPHAALNWTPATGARDAASGDFQALTGIGRVCWVPSSITVSGGTTIDVTMLSRRSQ